MISYRIIALSNAEDDFAVYVNRGKGIYGTSMVYRGTHMQCRNYVRGGK